MEQGFPASLLQPTFSSSHQKDTTGRDVIKEPLFALLSRPFSRYQSRYALFRWKVWARFIRAWLGNWSDVRRGLRPSASFMLSAYHLPGSLVAEIGSFLRITVQLFQWSVFFSHAPLDKSHNQNLKRSGDWRETWDKRKGLYV